MPGRGPAPKPDSLRARRNRHTTAATLPSQAEAHALARGRKVPRLPARPATEDGSRPWDKRSLDWWREVMRSPMATTYLDADRFALALAWELVDEFYQQANDEPGTKGRVSRLVMLAVEIRQQIARFGISPRDRLSLHWHVPPDDDASPNRGPSPAPIPIDDPRRRMRSSEDAPA